jgi:outer membrane autotransporter protein
LLRQVADPDLKVRYQLACSLGEWADRDGAGGLMGHTQDTMGLMVGADRRLGNALRAGLAMGASHSDLGWDDTPHDATMRGTHLGAYASFDRGGYFLDGHLGFANFDNEADRWLGLAWAGLADRAKGEFDANAWYGRLKGGYVFQTGDWLMTPAASLQYAHLRQDGFVESGAGFLDERVHSADRDAFSGSLSARVARRIDAGAWRLTPHVQAEWQHRFDDDPASITANFTAIESEPFTVAGLAPVEDQAMIGAGVQAEYNHSLTVSLTLGTSLAGEYDTRSIGAGLTWKF